MRGLAVSCFLFVALAGHCASVEVLPQQIVSQEDAVSNSPLVVVDDLGHAVALWQCREGQRESLKISSCSLCSKWSNPQRLREAKGQIKSPQLRLNGRGEVVALWVEQRGAESVLLSTARTESGEWSEEVVLSEDQGIRSPHMALNDLGQVVAVWAREGRIESATSLVGEAWSEMSVLSNGEERAQVPQVVINATGQIRVAWEQGKRVVSQTAFFGEAWSELKTLSGASAVAVRPQLFMNRAGQALALWECSQGYNVSLQGAYCRPGEGWSSAKDISDSGAVVSEPRGVINDHGDALVVWRSSSATGMSVCAASTTASGQWSAPLALSQNGENGINPCVALNNQEEALVIWRVFKEGASTLQGVSLSPGMTWSQPFDLTTSLSRIAQPFLAFNNQGSGILVWRQREDALSLIHSEVLSFSPIKAEEEEESGIAPPEEFVDEEPPLLIEKPEGAEPIPPPGEIEQYKPKKPHKMPGNVESIAPPEEFVDEEPPLLIEKPKGEKPIPPPGEIEQYKPKQPHEMPGNAKSIPPPEEIGAAELVEPESQVEEPEATPEEIEKEQPVLPVEEPVVEEQIREVPVCISPTPVCCCPRPARWLFEVRGSAFFPTESLFRSAFGHVYANGSLLLGYTFCDRWSVVGTVDYLKKSSGAFRNLGEAKIQLIPVSALLRYHFVQGAWGSFYVGVGPRYFHLRSKNTVNADSRTITSEGIGAVGEAGILFDVTSCFTVDLFLSYSYGTVSGKSNRVLVKSKTVDVGGLQAGLGLGFRF